MNIKLIQYSIALSLQQLESDGSQLYQLQWKIDNNVINIPLTNDAFNKPLCTQSNLILDQNRVLEEKSTSIIFRVNEDILKEYKINLSKYLNSKLKQIDDILQINETTKLHIQWKFEKLYAIDLGDNQEKQVNFSPTNTQRKSQVITKKSVSIISPHDSKNNEQPIEIEKKTVEETNTTILKLIAENKKLKAQVIELKRQIDSLSQSKPIFIQAEVEGFLREYQMENEKLRKLLKLQVEKNQSLQEELKILNSTYLQNTKRFQLHIQQLEERFQEIQISCDNYIENINNFEQSTLQDLQKLQDLEDQEVERKKELQKLFKGKIINNISEIQNGQSNNASIYSSQQDNQEKQQANSQTKEIYELLDND
ncbi:unnamed protein product (macronuclear) [Paramecium tetraurelia]|uniref:C2 NT-type domain-containing protein n=1 Tax=Paramecium tetraurelia TaxID=5888 RepID=A0DBC3_PARTE|nr:uncharacterized protein GSPATT00015234001 [Paramecium tetraurelia]CAK80340.1 unnamed protein product [Paramecium tetraurelia]|eukprot:XP_001447737.1 hypothetical protein (macronuclear) [Paramecium tetraurelia strain d4-2]